MKVDHFDVLICGVGGQGIITVGTLISVSAMMEGKKVVMSEVHGMAQRGGSVVSEVRIGEVHGPIIPRGHAEMLLGFEILEPLRHFEKIGPNTILLVNDYKIMPLPVLLGEEKYPEREEVVRELKRQGKEVHLIDALKLAEKAGSPIVANVVMLGAAIKLGLPIQKETVEKVLEQRYRGKVLEINKKALELGYNSIP